MRYIKPDYELYDGQICQKCGHKINYCKCLRKKPVPGNIFYSIGFTTRGCIRECPFCIVRQKEGKFQKWQPITNFHDEKYKIVILLDNNVYADKAWFLKTTDFILENNLKFNAIQGMDIRLLDPDIANRLKELDWYGKMHFAFDNMKDEKAVRRGIEILKDAKINIRQNVQFYVLVGFNTSEEEDKYRCRLLKKLGTNPFVMPYVKNEWTNKIARWANFKGTFWTCDIDDYDQRVAKKLRKEKNAKSKSNGSLWEESI